MWWAVGYAFAYGSCGDGPFIGHSNFFLSQTKYQTTSFFAHWLYTLFFCATSNAIVHGALSERMKFGAYLVYTVMLAGWVYPVIVHWTWSLDGWLSSYRVPDCATGVREPTLSTSNGVMDFAGSGSVHMVGGTTALWGALVLGELLHRHRAYFVAFAHTTSSTLYVFHTCRSTPRSFQPGWVCHRVSRQLPLVSSLGHCCPVVWLVWYVEDCVGGVKYTGFNTLPINNNCTIIIIIPMIRFQSRIHRVLLRLHDHCLACGSQHHAVGCNWWPDCFVFELVFGSPRRYWPHAQRHLDSLGCDHIPVCHVLPICSRHHRHGMLCAIFTCATVVYICCSQEMTDDKDNNNCCA